MLRMLDPRGRTEELGLESLQQQRRQEDGDRNDERDPHDDGYPWRGPSTRHAEEAARTGYTSTASLTTP